MDVWILAFQFWFYVYTGGSRNSRNFPLKLRQVQNQLPLELLSSRGRQEPKWGILSFKINGEKGGRCKEPEFYTPPKTNECPFEKGPFYIKEKDIFQASVFSWHVSFLNFTHLWANFKTKLRWVGNGHPKMVVVNFFPKQFMFIRSLAQNTSFWMLLTQDFWTNHPQWKSDLPLKPWENPGKSTSFPKKELRIHTPEIFNEWNPNNPHQFASSVFHPFPSIFQVQNVKLQGCTNDW